MNKNSIFKLSFFGLAMAFATISLIPSVIEPVCWLVIFIICAYIIAKKCNRHYFLNGFMVCLLNAVWITSAHILFFNTYMANHLDEAAMMAETPMPTHLRLMMLITGPVIGIISGLVLGMFSFVASKVLKKKI